MILVTGGTGLLGSHLLLALTQKKMPVKAIYRQKKTIDRVKKIFSYYSETPSGLFNTIEWVEADITNIPQLELAFKNVTHVYHCAAMVSFEPDKYHSLRKINIEGTANIVNLCISNSVKKLCYVSSVAAIGQETNSKTRITETTDWNPETDNSVYAITKYDAELEVWRGTQEGLNAVIVNPGVILGAGYWHVGSSGFLFKKIYSGVSRFPKGTKGYIDVSDVVKCMILLMQSPLKNERYILVAANLSFETFQTKVAEALCVKPPKKALENWQLAIAWRLDWLHNILTGKRRLLSKQLAASIQNYTAYDNSKLKSALAFNFKSIDESIKEVSNTFLEDLEA